MKMMKTMLVLLLGLSLLGGCAKKAPVEETKPETPVVEPVIENEKAPIVIDQRTFVDLLVNYLPREKTMEARGDNPEFNEFMEALFKDMVGEDYATLHFTIKNPSAYGIEKPEVSWGVIDYDDHSNQEMFAEMYYDLLEFDYDSLSYRQQYDFEAMEYSLLETVALSFFDRYSSFFTQKNDLVSNLISNLSEFPYYDEESLDDYLVLLKDTERYLDEALAFTERQYDEGIYISDSDLDYVIDYINSILGAPVNAIYSAVKRNIADLDFMDANKQESYLKQVDQILKESFCPALEKVAKTLENYYGMTTSKEKALCHIDEDYAKVSYIVDCSSNQDLGESLEEMKALCAYLLYNAMEAANDNDAVNEYYAYADAPAMDYNDLLEFLRKELVLEYPDLGDVDYDVDVLDPSSASDNILAYYFQAPIDALNQNIIRVNPNTLDDALVESYTTLAHEGFPGHLYQHVYYYRTNPHPVRTTITFSGYTEGYAVMSEYRCFDFLEMESELTKELLRYDGLYYFPLYSYLDMGINLFNWDENDLKNAMEELGLDGSSAPFFYDFLVDMHGVYCYYGVGFKNFFMLEMMAKEELGENFDYVSYHETILKNGPLPFPILEGAVREYVEANR